MASLDERCRDQLIPEPIAFIVEAPGVVRFASDHLPWRALIDVRGGFINGPLVVIDHKTGMVVITAGNRTALYERASVGLRGEWICNLRAEAPVK